MDPTSTGTEHTEQSKVQVAKEEAAAQAQSVAQTATEQTRSAVSSVTEEVKAQLSEQQTRLAATVRHIGDELEQASQGSSGTVADLAERAAHTSHDASRWLETHDARDVMDSIEEFARRRPGVFLLGAAALGLLVGRVTRSAVAARRNHGGAEQTIDLRGQEMASVPPLMGESIQASDPHLTGEVVVDEVLLVESSGPLQQRGYDPESAYPNNDQPVDPGEVLPEPGTRIGQGRRERGAL